MYVRAGTAVGQGTIPRHDVSGLRKEDTLEEEKTPTQGASENGPPGRKMHWTWLEPVLYALLALVLNLAGNARTGLWDRDEPRYAVCVREMRDRGDWIFPTFNGEPRYHKPVLIYWLMRLSTALGGDNPFGARLVSALAGAATVLGVTVLGRRMLGSGGGLAGLILATAPIAVAESKLATTDATLALLIFGCQFCLWELGKRPSRMLAGLFWLCMSLAILVKGPVAPALIAAASILAWCCGWRTAAWRRLYWRNGLIGLAILTLPWFVAITIASKGEFLRFAIGRQILHRVSTDMEAHGGFHGYYPVVSTLVFYPWSAFIPAALVGAWVRRKSGPKFGFLIGWAVGPLVLLECFQTKLIHYYLPAFAACALLLSWLTGSIAADEVNIRRRPLGRLGLALLVGIGLAGAVALAAGAVVIRGNLALPMLVVGMLVALGAVGGMLWLQRGATKRAVYFVAGTWAVILLCCCAWLVPLTEPYRTSRLIGEKLAAHSALLGIEPVLLEYQEPGVIYALGHPAATTRDRDGFFSHLKGGRSVLTVALPSEIAVMRKHFGLVVTPVDQVDGFVLTKGKSQTLQIAVVSEGEPPTAEAPSDPHVHRVGLKETLVK
jgi:4-amino-4-deoxy-L-arabinose transferase-like glycosyltransferase